MIAGIVVIGMLLTPALYAWFNILGFWDPYSETGNLEVAVANTDEGYQSDLIPTKINAGEQIVTELRGNEEFKWEFTDEQAAVEGVKSGKYFAALVIPKSFSADLLTIFSGHTQHAQIKYYINQKENAVAPKVTEKGANQLSAEINEEFSGAVAEVALDTTSSLMNFVGGDGVGNFAAGLNRSLDEMVKGLDLAAAQAEDFAELTDATSELAKSTGEVLDKLGVASGQTRGLLGQVDSGLTNGMTAVNNAVGVADGAVAGVSSGIGEIKGSLEGTFEAYKPLPEDVNGVLKQAGNDIGELDAKLGAMAGVICGDGGGDAGSGESENTKICESIGNARAELKTLQKLLEQLESKIGSDGAAAGQMGQEIIAQLDKAEQALTGVQSSLKSEITGQLTELKNTLSGAQSTAATLSSDLDTMTSQMSQAAGSLSTGMATTSDALHKASGLLEKAATTLAGERDKLSLAMASGDLNKVREIIGSNPEEMAQFMASPAKLERIAVYEMDNNGSAMTPFYTSLAIWVGSIFLVALMETVVSKHQVEGLENPTPGQLYLGRYLIFLTFSLLQATIVCLGDVIFLGTQCENFGLFMLTGWACALVFSSIVYTLTLSFNKVGECLAIILVVWQVAGAGGIFPVVLSAPIFQEIYPWLPFTHSLNAFEGAMAGIYANQYWESIGKLLLFLIPMLVLGLVLRRPVIKLNEWAQGKMDETGIL